jgi:hypothetical protein
MDVSPFVCRQDNTDNKIIYTPDDDRYWNNSGEYEVKDKYASIYVKMKPFMAEIQARKRDMINILKAAHKHNMEELNKEVFNLVCVDIEFRKGIIPRLPGL